MARFLKEQRPGGDLQREAAKYVDPDTEVPDTAAAIAGAGDILAEELALRDMDGEPLTRENYGELMDRIDAYLSEFDEHGTDNISVDLP